MSPLRSCDSGMKLACDRPTDRQAGQGNFLRRFYTLQSGSVICCGKRTLHAHLIRASTSHACDRPTDRQAGQGNFLRRFYTLQSGSVICCGKRTLHAHLIRASTSHAFFLRNLFFRARGLFLIVPLKTLGKRTLPARLIRASSSHANTKTDRPVFLAKREK